MMARTASNDFRPVQTTPPSGFRPVLVRVFAWPSPFSDFLCDSRIRWQVDSNVVSGVFSWRRGSESNRRIKVLQTLALPLGYRAPWQGVLSGT